MHRWTIARRLFAVVGTLVSLLAITGVASLLGTITIKGHLEETANKTAVRLGLARECETLVTQLFFEERSLILASVMNDSALAQRAAERRDNELASLQDRVKQLGGLVRTESGRRAVADLAAAVQGWRDLHAEVLRLVGAGQAADGHALSDKRGKPLRDAMRASIQTIVKNQEQFLKEDATAAESDAARLMITLAVSFGLGLLVAMAALLVIRAVNRRLKGISGNVRGGAEQVTSAAAEVAGAAQTLSQGASEQAASLEETSASMEEIGAVARQNAKTAEGCTELVGSAAKGVERMNVAVEEMVSSMNDITESSRKVSKIIKTIDEIAFQTNILALNAAVEAARAGEAGLGFAVVADEVRNLAQRSADAARDTSALIEESIARSRQGQAKLAQVGQAVTAITATVGDVRRAVEEMAGASRQQTQGIQQVAEAISQMEKVTQSVAATAEESAAASEELAGQAEMAKQSSQELAELVGVASE
jgi:methyl-accepting chemotaxis protein/methyl-accepting chemotaxis protein-1 (serine sensor receptor)